MTEEELLRAAAKLGEHEVEHIDEAKLAKAVLARVAGDPVVAAPPLHRRLWVLVLAAAATILLVVRLSLPGRENPTDSADATPPSVTVLHELDDLTVPELERVLESLPPPAAVTSHPDPRSLDGLDAKSLELLLRSLEG
jgi:hypothetical protein